MMNAIRRWWLVLAVIVVVAAGVPGCEHAGYENSSPSIAETQPLAVGAEWTVELEERINKFPDTEQTQCETIDEATSLDRDVAQVVEISGCEVTVVGVGAGETRVEFSTGWRHGGDFGVTVKELDRVELSHGCTENDRAAYERRAEIYPHYRLMSVDDMLLYGDVLPIEFEPADMVSVLSNYPGSSLTQPGWGSVMLVSEEVADTVSASVAPGDDELEFHFVDRGEVDGVDLEFEASSEAQSLEVGGDTELESQLFVGEDALCGWKSGEEALEVEVRSETPEICDVRPHAHGDLGAYSTRYGPVDSGYVKGLAAGNCRVRVTFPELDAGEGLSDDVEFPVQESSDADGGD